MAGQFAAVSSISLSSTMLQNLAVVSFREEVTHFLD
jgi:hypothetical protein